MNRDLLAEYNIYYPSVNESSNHTVLLFADCDDDELFGVYGRDNSRKIQLSVEKSERCWDDVADLCRRRPNCTVVLSSEYFISLRPSTLRRITARLRSISDYVHLTGYLRSPTARVLSGLQQRLRFGSELNVRLNVRHRQWCEKILSLGVDRVCFRLFERTALEGQSIVHDFIRHGLAMHEVELSRFKEHQENESITAEEMAVIRDFNATHFPCRRLVGNLLSSGILNEMSKERLKFSCTRPALKGEVASLVEQANISDNHWIRKKLGLQFSDVDYSAPIPRVSQSSLEPDELAEIVPFNSGVASRLRTKVVVNLLDRVRLGDEYLGTHEVSVYGSSILNEIFLEADGRPEIAWRARPLISKAERKIAQSGGRIGISSGLCGDPRTAEIYCRVMKMLVELERHQKS